MNDVLFSPLRLFELELLIQNSVEKAMKSSGSRKESDLEKLLNLDELIAELPNHPAKQTVYGWVNHRKIPFEKHGSKLYFRKTLIDEWLSNGRQMTHLK